MDSKKCTKKNNYKFLWFLTIPLEGHCSFGLGAFRPLYLPVIGPKSAKAASATGMPLPGGDQSGFMGKWRNSEEPNSGPTFPRPTPFAFHNLSAIPHSQLRLSLENIINSRVPPTYRGIVISRSLQPHLSFRLLDLYFIFVTLKKKKILRVVRRRIGSFISEICYSPIFIIPIWKYSSRYVNHPRFKLTL